VIGYRMRYVFSTLMGILYKIPKNLGILYKIPKGAENDASVGILIKIPKKLGIMYKIPTEPSQIKAADYHLLKRGHNLTFQIMHQ
jgi:hypothetical protein